MPEEFKVNRINDAQIEIEDVEEGHLWTFTIGANSAGERLLSSGLQRSPDHARADALGARARRFADREALAAGKVDRLTAP